MKILDWLRARPAVWAAVYCACVLGVVGLSIVLTNAYHMVFP